MMMLRAFTPVACWTWELTVSYKRLPLVTSYIKLWGL
jgi:hypothetical protein